MHDLYDNLEQLCETVADEISASNEKINAAGGKLTSGDVDYLDKLTHMLKSIKTTKAMIDAEGYGWDDMPDGSSRTMASYRAGRGRNAKRDSMGRYSRDNGSYNNQYDRSYDGDMIAELRELMEEAPNGKIRQRFQQFISEVERMK